MLSFALLAACSTPEAPKPKKEAAPASTCDVSAEKLAGSAWLHLKPQPTGPEKPNPMARVRFRDEGGALLADYTAGSAGDVYAYTCSTKGKIVTCIEKETHADAFCKAWAATHDGVCDPAAVAQVTGIPQAEFDKVADKVNAELKKLKAAEKEQQRKSDNSPNNKIRGKFRVAVNPASCGLTLEDKYQTLVDGKVQEYENVLGNAKFTRAKEEYSWESCKDADSAWAPGPDDSNLAVQPQGTIKFSAMLQKDQRGAANCTYTADIWKDYVKIQSDVPTTNDPKWGPRWDTQVPFTEVGKHTVYFDRYKECGGKKERIGLTCALVRVE
jgi:hypothetical protein